MPVKPTPKGITLNKAENYLEIEWAHEEETSRYPLPHLREACPCVECRGGHEFMTPAYDPDNILELTPARSYTVTTIHMVGNYALQPVWDDGHDSGIYTWEYLWKIRSQTS